MPTNYANSTNYLVSLKELYSLDPELDKILSCLPSRYFQCTRDELLQNVKSWNSIEKALYDADMIIEKLSKPSAGNNCMKDLVYANNPFLAMNKEAAFSGKYHPLPIK